MTPELSPQERIRQLEAELAALRAQIPGQEPVQPLSSSPATNPMDALRQAWLEQNNIGPAFIPLGQPWKNGFIESFHDKFRDECLQREWFQSLLEAQAVIEAWRMHYNIQRPHSSLDYQNSNSLCRTASQPSCPDSHFNWTQKLRHISPFWSLLSCQSMLCKNLSGSKTKPMKLCYGKTSTGQPS